MKLSVNWLKDFVDINCPLEELADGLTMAGLEVEAIDKMSPERLVGSGGAGLAEDTVFDVKITPNRGDWLSMLGVAREAAPLLGASVRIPEPGPVESDPPSSECIKIEILDPDLCGRYAGIVLRGVTIKESPGWIKDRLIASGMRPINNVVDVTNYVMLELGQPLHAFDYSLLRGGRIIVRRAHPGETITSIDAVERKLDPDMLVIADSDRAVAIAGVMGGADSEISEQTKDILIESANFDSISVRRTSKRLSMVTESSYRFERGVDPSVAPLAALRAAALIQELGGGEVARGMVDARPRVVEPLVIEVRPERANAILGFEMSASEMADNLKKLGIDTRDDRGKLICTVPTFRQDVTREIDIVEEIGRAYGYDRMPMTLPPKSMRGRDSREGVFAGKLRRILMSCGAHEALTHSMVDSALAPNAGAEQTCLRIRNPLSEELDSMRAALAPNLLEVLARNQAFGIAGASLFEIGKVYFDRSGEIGEKMSVAGAMVGSMWRDSWGLPARALDVDFFACKGLVESLFAALNVEDVVFEPVVSPLLHPTRAARARVGETEIGVFGEAHPDTAEALDVRGRPCVYEMDFAALMEAAPEVVKVEDLPRYPAVNRHLAVVVSDDVNYAKIASLVSEVGGGLFRRLDLLDVYTGEQIGANRSSLTLSVTFRSDEKTLTDDEVNCALQAIREALATRLAATFR